jgi:DNA-binding transcriptional regulator YhcF (GntR family)
METWNTVKTLKDIAEAYQNIYEKKEFDPSRDKDGDGDNDFADNMIARMVASGMSREEAIKKVKNKEYNKEEFALDEETKAEKEARIAARRARVKEMEKEGAVMTSSRRASEVAKQRKEAKRAEAAERAASSVLNQMRGATGRVSERPMGSEAPKPKEKAPEATRRLNPNLRRDNLGSAADRILRSMKKEEVEAYETYEFVASYLLENNFANTIEDANAIINNMSESWFAQIVQG